MPTDQLDSRRTVFHPRLADLTDQWMDLFGYAAPAVVSTTIEEYRACREAAALMDFSMLRKVDIEGPGAAELVDSIVTRDLSKVPQGRIAYGALTNDDGKMIDDCTCMVRSPVRGAVLRRERPRRRDLRGAGGRFAHRRRNAPMRSRTSASRGRRAGRFSSR